MIKTVCEQNQCTGCMACLDKCGLGAISIQDGLRFYNAVIDTQKCVGCGICERVCQVRNGMDKFEPITWKQGWAQDPEVRARSSSGGFATAIALNFVKTGGVVCSCALERGVFGFRVARTEEEVEKFSGSKYIKSNPKGCYANVEKELKAGRKVLFIALPCQVAAMKNYLPSHLQNDLFTVDLICHGTPSPQILERYLNENKVCLSCAEDIKFRVKDCFKLFSDGKAIKAKGVCDPYLIAFLESVCYTENCYHCDYARLARVSDLTIGDSWGSGLSYIEQKKGISLALATTEKGNWLLENSRLVLHDVDLEAAVKANHQLDHPSVQPKKYDMFFGLLESGKSLGEIVFRCYPKRSAKQMIKSMLIKAHVISREV